MRDDRLYALVVGLVFSFLAYPILGGAQETDTLSRSIKQEFRLYYRCDEIAIDSSYLDNTLQMDTIIRYLARSPRIDSITVYAYASPEGGFRRNKWLAEQRAEAAKGFILSHLGKGMQVPAINCVPIPEHWDGFYEEVDANYHRHDRAKVLKIIKDDRVGDETKKWRLQQLDNGYTWKYLIRKHMPELRVATWICIWVPIKDIKEITPIISRAEYTEKQLVKPEEPKRKPYVPALKTNLLYDLGTVLNASVEFPIGKRFSIMVEDVFPWWSWGPNDKKFCLQLWEMGIEPRWWFKPNGNLKGHFLGVYGKSAKYDFQNDRDICYQGEYWSAGVSYGYAMKLGDHLQMEFSLSVGYLQSDYRHYQPDPNYEHLFRDKYRTGTISYFGPTKLAVKLVLPIRLGPKTTTASNY